MSTNSPSTGNESFKGWNLIKKVKRNSIGNSNSDDDGSVVIIEREILDLSNESSDESDESNISSVSVKRDSPNGFINDKHNSSIQHHQNHVYETKLQLEDYFRIVVFAASIILAFSFFFSFTVSDDYTEEVIYPSVVGTRKYDVIKLMREKGESNNKYLDLLNEITDVIFHAILVNQNTYLLNLRHIKDKEKLLSRHPNLFNRNIRNQVNAEIGNDIWWIDKENLRSVLQSYSRIVHIYTSELLLLNRMILHNIDNNKFDKYFPTRHDVKSANFSQNNDDSNGSLNSIPKNATADSDNSSRKRNITREADTDFLTVKNDGESTDSEHANTNNDQFDCSRNSDAVPNETKSNTETTQNEYDSTENDRSDTSAKESDYSQNIVPYKASTDFESVQEDNSVDGYRSDSIAEELVYENPLISRTEYYHPKKLTDTNETGDEIIKNDERPVKHFECESRINCVRKFYKHDKKNNNVNNNKIKSDSTDNCKKSPCSRRRTIEKSDIDFDETGNSEKKMSFQHVANGKGAERINKMEKPGKEHFKYADYNKQFAADRLPPKQSPQLPLPEEDYASTDDGNKRFWKSMPDELFRSFRKTNENIFSSIWNRNEVKVQKVLKKVQRKVDKAIDNLQKQYRKLLWMIP